MQLYWMERIVIAAVVTVFFLIIEFLFANPLTGWMFLMVCTYVIGFTHYGVGSIYQVKFLGRTQGRAAWWWLSVLACLSLVLPLAAYYLGYFGVFSFVTIGYFMLHGYFNELTLYERTTNEQPDEFLVFSVASVILGVLFLSTAHPSRLFDPYLTFFSPESLASSVLSAFRVVAEWGWYLGVGCFSLAVLALLVQLGLRSCSLQYRNFGGLVAILSVCAVALVLYPMSYVHLLSGVLLYHFLIWFWFYFRRFKQKSTKDFNTYLLLHAAIVVPILLLIAVSGLDLARLFVINSYVFLVLTTIHITTSFLSERWLQRWLFKN